MLNKISIIIILLCGIVSADFLDNTNSYFCEVSNNGNVEISCDITENAEHVTRTVFIMSHDARDCKEYTYYEDGTQKQTLLSSYVNAGYIHVIMKDEYYVILESTKSLTSIAKINKLCIERYTKYKEAKNR